MYMVEQDILWIEVRAYSIDLDNYIKHYNFSCKLKNGFTNVESIRKNEDVSSVECFYANPDASNCRLTIFIISPQKCKLSPLNIIVNVYRGENRVDVRRFSRKWDEDTLTIDLTYSL